MKYLKILKAVGVIFACLCASKGLSIAYDYSLKEIEITKRNIAASVIDSDLAGKDLTVDIKSKQQKNASKLTHDEMQKVIWVLSVQNDQLKATLDMVKSAIDYNQE